jgi:hypothetical protein
MNIARSIFFLLATCLAVHLQAQSSDSEPAVIGQGGNSVASKLHYPASAKAAKKEAAVHFYCEVGRDGQARHTRIIAEDPRGPFREAVAKALAQGRFTPARVGGKNVAVMMGGTVMFVSANGQPTIMITLSSAERDKAASRQNYIQPQMLMDFHDFEQKIILFAKAESLGFTSAPAAEITTNVDANGNAGPMKLVAESKYGWGRVAQRACEGAKFIPARANGKPVAGQFNFPIDFRMIQEREQVTGSRVKPRDEY